MTSLEASAVTASRLNDPAVLLLDEPFRGLDEQGLDALCKLVVRKASGGTTMLIVAPLIAAVTPIADSSYRIDEGTVRSVGLGLSSQLEQR
jgi:ABC-type multidrug transport system ATPase subunit